MAYAARNRQMGKALLPPSLTLAWQRLRKTWHLLAITQLGLVSAVLLACVVPLYATITLTASLRDTLNSYAQNSDIVVRTQPQLISSSILNTTTQRLNQELKHTLGAYLEPVQFSIETQILPLLSVEKQGKPSPAPRAGVGLISAQMNLAAPHLTMLQGRLPQATGSVLEIAMTPENARILSVNVGDEIVVAVNFTDVYNKVFTHELHLRLVGLFKPASDFFWHGDDFAPYQDRTINLYALVPNEALVQVLDASSSSTGRQRVFVSSPDVIWYYRLDISRISIDDLSKLTNGIATTQLDNANNPDLENDPYLEQTQTYLPSPETFNGLAARVSVIEFPVLSMMIMILGLLLFFIGMMMGLLVERQKEAIAVLRSRGASGSQIIGALLLQGILMVGIALAGGFLLALIGVRLLTWQMLSGNDQGALEATIGNPLQALSRVELPLLLSGAIILLALGFTIWSANRRDIMSLRQETTRSTQRSLWQRLRLDMVTALIALAGYAFSIYLLNSQTLNSQLYLLLISPLSLLQIVCLLLAGLMLFLRFSPLLLRQGSKLAFRRRGAAPVLALAQIARSPRQAVSVILLLALTSAFALFGLIFTASQNQRMSDVAAYQTGADFSGTIPVPLYSTPDLSKQVERYRRIPGVQAASLGFKQEAQAGGVLNLPVDFQAVDASTFARAASWSPQQSSQPLTDLMQLLRAQNNPKSVPAIVDANTWDTLHLSSNSLFTLQIPSAATDHPLELRAIVRVQHIPTSGNPALPGVLVDYTTFARIYTNNFHELEGSKIALNYVWLQTRDDSSSLSSVRRLLSTGELRLVPLYDRRAIEKVLSTDPIYLTLQGELEIGALTALLLALAGSLIASWISVQSRLKNFLALRALGAGPGQVVSTLAWEQGMIYSGALLLGIGIGALLALLSLPSLVLTSILPSQITGNVINTNFYAAQFVPPLQVIVPFTLWLVLLALVLICLLVLSLMVRKVTSSSLSMILRLNED